MSSVDHRQLIVDAFDAWSRGDQPGAVELVRPHADAGDRTALALICWLLSQRGEPHWREGVPYAETAIQKGMPWVAGYYFGQMMGDTSLRQRTPSMLRGAFEAGWWQVDAVGQALNPFQQGDRGTAVNLVEAASAARPVPEGWEDFLAQARRALDEVTTSADAVSGKRAEALESIESDAAIIEGHRATVETRTKQLVTLIDQTTNAQVQSFFDTEAKTYEKESRSLWSWGVGVLGAASLLAILPIAAYYLGRILDRNWFTDENLTLAHFAPAVALGAVAGVLLARARGRDRARQRARDLSVALATMFVYTGQIADEEERKRFVHEMGRTVIEAFLRQDAPFTDAENTSLLAALTRRG